MSSRITRSEKPKLTANLRSVWDVDEAPALDVLAELRGHPGLASLLKADDDELVRRYPSFPLAVLGAAPDALDTLLRALDLVVRPSTP
ncbi:hypothetical protein ACFXGA_29040 [Actinosynnema sp. NPDC059335]|uniref:hypothetical protein n=1 Tax=Actinosynnema sp. NPDC059335 TaxID=3346804 RepID=UPI00366FFBA5